MVSCCSSQPTSKSIIPLKKDTITVYHFKAFSLTFFSYSRFHISLSWKGTYFRCTDPRLSFFHSFKTRVPKPTKLRHNIHHIIYSIYFNYSIGKTKSTNTRYNIILDRLPLVLHHHISIIKEKLLSIISL